MPSHWLVFVLLSSTLCLLAPASPVGRSVLYIQSMWRMARQRLVFVQLRGAAIALQAHWRARQARLLFAEMVRRHYAAVAVQVRQRAWLWLLGAWG